MGRVAPFAGRLGGSRVRQGAEAEEGGRQRRAPPARLTSARFMLQSTGPGAGLFADARERGRDDRLQHGTLHRQKGDP
jgi:hypothetical protein